MRRLALIATMSALSSALAAPPALPRNIADVRWNVSSAVFGDSTCRGQKDMALFGVSEISGFVVMIQPARKGSKPSFLVFATRGRDPRNLHLTIEDLDYQSNEDFKRQIEPSAPDLQPSKTCKGLSLGDGETDSHHIYWNRLNKTFASWSL